VVLSLPSPVARLPQGLCWGAPASHCTGFVRLTAHTVPILEAHPQHTHTTHPHKAKNTHYALEGGKWLPVCGRMGFVFVFCFAFILTSLWLAPIRWVLALLFSLSSPSFLLLWNRWLRVRIYPLTAPPHPSSFPPLPSLFSALLTRACCVWWIRD